MTLKMISISSDMNVLELLYINKESIKIRIFTLKWNSYIPHNYIYSDKISIKLI